MRGRADDCERIGGRGQSGGTLQNLTEGVDLLSGPVREVLERAISDLTILAIGLAQEDGRRGVSVGDDRHVHVDMIAYLDLHIKHNITIYMTIIRRPKSSSTIKIKEFT